MSTSEISGREGTSPVTLENNGYGSEHTMPPKKTIDLSENARVVLGKRYLRRGQDGKPAETVEGMFWRVATHIAKPDGEYGGDARKTALEFYDLLTDLRFMPNSPTFTGAGTPLGQLAACFVLPIEDDMGKNPDGIFSTLRNAALIQQTGGGNGFSFSRLRPKNDRVVSSAGTASGPVGFLRVYDGAFGEIAQGGTRRGANMALLRVDHPDVEEFITCKSEEGSISNFNISVGVTDAFIEAVVADDDFPLVNPRTKEVARTVRARDLFEQITTQAHHNGEPGVLFLDTANRANPVPHLYELEATNPCGEQWLGPYENCCLGSINLAKHVTEEDQVDWEGLRQSVVTSTHFLDNVVSVNAYVPSVKQLKEAAERARRIGLGIMGLGDMMYHLGVRYGSEEAQEFAAQVMEFVRFHCMKASIALAKERGPFPAIGGSIYDTEDLKWEPPKPLMTYTRDWGRPKFDWDQIVAEVKKHGIRNAAQTTVAPTGTIATVAGCEGYGCEPVFALAYLRHFKDGDNDVHLAYASPLFESALERAGLNEEDRRRIVTEVSEAGSCQHISVLPDWIRHAFVVAGDIGAEEHVLMQAAMQAFVDNSISKTVNFPETATVKDVARAYQLAWKSGCKGLTVYVTGTREKVVLEIRKSAGDKEEGQADSTQVADTRETGLTAMGMVKPRPAVLWGETYRQPTPLGTAYVTVNIGEDNEPFEVFLNGVGKAGSDLTSLAESVGRLISLILRLPSTMTPRARLKEVVSQLSGIGGERSMGFGPTRVRSLPDGIARTLAEHLSKTSTDEPEVVPGEQLALPLTNPTVLGDFCPECGNASLVNEEGCRKCYSCGFSEC